MPGQQADQFLAGVAGRAGHRDAGAPGRGLGHGPVSHVRNSCSHVSQQAKKNIYTFLCINSQDSGISFDGRVLRRRPARTTMKTRRQSVVLDVVQRQPVRNQEQLRRLVRAAGFDVTQATLSRDIRELALVKGGSDAAYQAPVPAGSNGHAAKVLLNRAVAEYLTRVDRVEQLVVLRTGPGQAQLLGVALDGARLPEVVGTIAGDDTILAITPDVRRARALVRWLEALSKP
ncbi:MAG: arginine repressor [Acidobacteria bacterium]|nr:arginine repressor [Acidobacteriota bacterium]